MVTMSVLHSHMETSRSGHSSIRGRAWTIDRLRQAFFLAERQPEQEQEALAALLLEEMVDDDRWKALFADPRGTSLLARLAEEPAREDQAQRTELIKSQS